MGIGLELAKDTKTGWARVVTPIKDGPAYRAGLRADDLITHMRVNSDQEDQPAQTLATADLKLDVVNRKLMGKFGTSVQLTVRRPGAAEAVVVAVRRGRVEVEPVLGWRRQADDSWNFWLDEKNQIGYVRLRNMDRHTSTELATVLQRLEKSRPARTDSRPAFQPWHEVGPDIGVGQPVSGQGPDRHLPAARRRTRLSVKAARCGPRYLLSA